MCVASVSSLCGMWMMRVRHDTVERLLLQLSKPSRRVSIVLVSIVTHNLSDGNEICTRHYRHCVAARCSYVHHKKPHNCICNIQLPTRRCCAVLGLWEYPSIQIVVVDCVALCSQRSAQMPPTLHQHVARFYHIFYATQLKYGHADARASKTKL